MECSNATNKKTGAIVVLYNPDIQSVRSALATLCATVDCLCLVDNSPVDNGAHFADMENTTYMAMMRNTGIAAAQNAGLRSLAKLGIHYVLFSDQDSIVRPETAETLRLGYEALLKRGIKVGGVGTRAINKETGMPYPSKSKELETVALSGETPTLNATHCSYIRSSVSLMRMSTFGDVGGFDESLFIDGVDNELCWRANAKGYSFFIVEEATITHHLGEGDRHIANRNVAISSVFRIYYQYRNYIWLCRRNYVPLWWKRLHLAKYAAKAIYYPLFVKPRTEYAKGIARGICDGLFKTNAQSEGKL